MQNKDDSFEDVTHNCGQQSDSYDSYYGTTSVDDDKDYADHEKIISP